MYHEDIDVVTGPPILALVRRTSVRAWAFTLTLLTKTTWCVDLTISWGGETARNLFRLHMGVSLQKVFNVAIPF